MESAPPLLVAASGFEELLQVLGRSGSEYIQIGPRSGSHRLMIGRFAGLGVMSLQISGAIILRSQSIADHLTINFDLGSGPGGRHNGQQIGRSDLVVLSSSAEYERRSAEHHRGMNFRVPLDLAARALAVREPDVLALPAPGVSLVAVECDASVSRLRQLVAPLLRWADGCGAPPLSPAAVSAQLIDALLDALLVPWRRAEGDKLRRP